ncbi:NTP transferase domain-containing protein, partial [bacterium]|nr:NTP transferase domain-containing protein [bacterium]
QNTIDSIQDLNKRVFLVFKNIHQKKYRSLKLEFAFDNESESASIFGLKTALSNCKHKYLLVLAADLPNFSAQIIRELLNKFQNKSIISNYRGLQPLASIYNVDIYQELNQYISTGSLAIQKFVRSIDYTLVDFEHLENNPFHNINTRNDLSLLESKQS